MSIRRLHDLCALYQRANNQCDQISAKLYHFGKLLKCFAIFGWFYVIFGHFWQICNALGKKIIEVKVPNIEQIIWITLKEQNGAK